MVLARNPSQPYLQSNHMQRKILHHHRTHTHIYIYTQSRPLTCGVLIGKVDSMMITPAILINYSVVHAYRLLCTCEVLKNETPNGYIPVRLVQNA